MSIKMLTLSDSHLRMEINADIANLLSNHLISGLETTSKQMPDEHILWKLIIYCFQHLPIFSSLTLGQSSLQGGSENDDTLSSSIMIQIIIHSQNLSAVVMILVGVIQKIFQQKITAEIKNIKMTLHLGGSGSNMILDQIMDLLLGTLAYWYIRETNNLSISPMHFWWLNVWHNYTNN